MGVVYNRGKQTSNRKHLRNNVTEAEKILWSRLKANQLLDFKFRRQHGVASYVLDFYCPVARLAIEIDGETHSTDEEIESDCIRRQTIEKKGIRFLRFANREIYDNLNGVLQTIGEKLLECQPTPDNESAK